MNRLVKPILNTAKCRHINRAIQTSHVQSMDRRNFGFMAQIQQPTNLLQRNETVYHQRNDGAKRCNSTAAPVANEIAPVASQLVPGFFDAIYLSLSSSAPVGYMQQALIEIHDFTGLPWWASIVASTFIFRSIVTLPLTIYQHRITARIEMIALEMPAIVEQLKREAAMAMRKFKWTEQQTQIVYQRSIKKQWSNLIVRDNCHPAKSFIVLWGQIPLWIFQSMALRNMIYMLPDPNSLQATIVISQLTVGGFGWIPNLTEVDNSYILPVTLGLLNLGIIEIQSMLRTRPSTRFHKIITNIFRGVSIFMVPIACTVPSALTVYWVTSSTYGLFQNLLLVSPPVRRALGIPKTNSELENPYATLWLKMKQRTGLESSIIVDNAETIANKTRETKENSYLSKPKK